MSSPTKVLLFTALGLLVVVGLWKASGPLQEISRDKDATPPKVNEPLEARDSTTDLLRERLQRSRLKSAEANYADQAERVNKFIEGIMKFPTRRASLTVINTQVVERAALADLGNATELNTVITWLSALLGSTQEEEKIIGYDLKSFGKKLSGMERVHLTHRRRIGEEEANIQVQAILEDGKSSGEIVFFVVPENGKWTVRNVIPPPAWRWEDKLTTKQVWPQGGPVWR